MTQPAQELLREALNHIPLEPTDCAGYKCRISNCIACNGEEDARLAVAENQSLANRISAHLATGGWMPMDSAPKNSTEILLRIKDKSEQTGYVVGHWADGGGEEQPPYRGWFMRSAYRGYVEIPAEILDWQPLPKEC